MLLSSSGPQGFESESALFSILDPDSDAGGRKFKKQTEKMQGNW